MIEPLQYITRDDCPIPPLEQIALVIEGGVKWVQLRMKSLKPDEFYYLAEEASDICKSNRVKFIINDHVEIAKALKADGIHIGKEDMHPAEARGILGNKAIIGCTANTFDDVKSLSKFSIDYIGLGPFTYTTTKKNLSPELGLKGYHHIITECQNNDIIKPIIAIGGIQRTDVIPILGTGVFGIAIAGAMGNNEMMQENAKAFLDEIKQFKSIKNYFHGTTEDRRQGI